MELQPLSMVLLNQYTTQLYHILSNHFQLLFARASVVQINRYCRRTISIVGKYHGGFSDENSFHLVASPRHICLTICNPESSRATNNAYQDAHHIRS